MAEIEITKASEVKVREIEWLWYPYIPFGKITVVQGDAGDGKSTFVLNLAAMLSRGQPMPFTDGTGKALPSGRSAYPHRRGAGKKPHSMDALLALLSVSGYEVKRGKNITLMKAGRKNIRLNSLGEGYTEKELFAAISGAATHTPRKNRRLTAPRKATLITEIEDKLNGRHSQWDSVRILKQMAQSVLYVQQHDFENFDALAAQSAAAARVSELSETMKTAEKRMAEIAVVKTHIINYSKTRDVYVGYRKAGYSQKYLAEHESDIIIHKAAKKAFDELGFKKLPTVKGLSTEYAGLLAKKEAAYVEYAEAKNEMRDFLVHKANVEYILGPEKQERTRIRAQERE